MKTWNVIFVIMVAWLGAGHSQEKPKKKYDDRSVPDLVQKTVEEVIEKFWHSVQHDENVQAALIYVNGCHFRKLVESVEKHKQFKKLKILLARNEIIDLSLRKLVPMKSILSKIPKHVANKQTVPDLTTFVDSVEELLHSLPPNTLAHYNLKHSTISRRIQEASLDNIIKYYVNEILTIPQTSKILHELIRLSFNLDEFIELTYCYFGVYDEYYQEDLKVTQVTEATRAPNKSATDASNEEEASGAKPPGNEIGLPDDLIGDLEKGGDKDGEGSGQDGEGSGQGGEGSGQDGEASGQGEEGPGQDAKETSKEDKSNNNSGEHNEDNTEANLQEEGSGDKNLESSGQGGEDKEEENTDSNKNQTITSLTPNDDGENAVSEQTEEGGEKPGVLNPEQSNESDKSTPENEIEEGSGNDGKKRDVTSSNPQEGTTTANPPM